MPSVERVIAEKVNPGRARAKGKKQSPVGCPQLDFHQLCRHDVQAVTNAGQFVVTGERERPRVQVGRGHDPDRLQKKPTNRVLRVRHIQVIGGVCRSISLVNRVRGLAGEVGRDVTVWFVARLSAHGPRARSVWSSSITHFTARLASTEIAWFIAAARSAPRGPVESWARIPRRARRRGGRSFAP